ncbi:MAG: cyanophycin synthetase, partial [Burkholderiaceae bacterium]
DPAVKLELTRQKLTPASVPAAGQTVVVARHGNVAIDVTDRVHPDFAAAASLAARIVGLDIAGIDLVAKDISRPMAEQGAAIVEVNAGPGLLMHLKPAEGTPRDVGADIARHLFGDGEDGRIPIVGISGSDGSGSTTAVARLVAHLLHLHGACVGLACADGLTLRGRRIDASDCANRDAGERLLMNRAVDAAVIENGFRSILTEGLAYDRCQVGIVTASDVARVLPDLHAEGIEQLHKVARTQVDVVLPQGAAVLNADDVHVAALAPLCDGDVILFSVAPDSERIAAHRAEGGRAVLVRDGCIMFVTGARERLLACPEAIALARAHCAVADLLAAAGAAWALGIGDELIRAGLKNYGLQRQDVAVAA